MTTAARRAIQERLERVRARATMGAAEDDVLPIIERGRARQVLDSRSPDEIIGYDASGLPT